VPWLRLDQVPPGCLLGLVVPPAQHGEVAFAGLAALVVGGGVVEVAALRGPVASGEDARPVPYLDQVPQCASWPIGGGLPLMRADGAFEPVEAQ
jgi:hypothetical protein